MFISIHEMGLLPYLAYLHAPFDPAYSLPLQLAHSYVIVARNFTYHDGAIS
jgi:hypothetical protein